MEALLLGLVSLALSTFGFKTYVWFFSLGYGFTITGLGITNLILFRDNLSLITIVMSILFIIFGMRLGIYLFIREIKNSTYAPIKESYYKKDAGIKIYVRIIMWINCALLYFAQASPLFFRLRNNTDTDIAGIVGVSMLFLGIIIEIVSDCIKNIYKRKHPNKVCNILLFKIVRCPSYFGEILMWTGVYISGITVYSSWSQWLIASFGYLEILYVMFSGARRLELRHNKNYGDDPEYQKYIKTTPILIPFIPLKSVAKYEF